MDIQKLIRKHALFNAFSFGKAEPGKIVGKVIAEEPSVKNDMKTLMSQIQDIVKEVNTVSKEQCEEELKSTFPEMLEKKEVQKKTLKELEDAKEGKVIMRFAPSPSGPMHIGHAMTGGLIAAYVNRYKGTYILRIEDTNADNIYEPAYEQLQKDAHWLFGNVSEVWIQSERIQIYYDYAQQLIEKNAAYICTCEPEKYKELNTNKKACPCRELGTAEQAQRWQKMLSKEGYREGEAVLRCKTEIDHPNPAMRDFPLARIKETPHPKTGTKYRVWPLMNLSVFTDDVEAGMTHIIRAKDHADNAKRQEYMYRALGKPIPKTYFTGRYNFLDLELSASKTKEKIKEGIYTGWEDIRLPFIQPLRRRGYQAKTFITLTEQIGLTNVDKTVSADEFFKSLNAINKELIEEKADRLFFIKEPVKIHIKGTPSKQITLNLHPEHRKGGRVLHIDEEFYIEKEDMQTIQEGNLYRLMDCLNFKKEHNAYVFVSFNVEDFKKQGTSIMHWLPKSEALPARLRMPDNTVYEGYIESSSKKITQDDVVQFERIGFCRLDDEEQREFWFAHS